MPIVVIITFCTNPLMLYGSALVFGSLRVGFPTARVIVYDNGSIEEVRGRIRTLAEEAGCEFIQLERHHYARNLRRVLYEQTEFNEIVLLDPDVVFWDRVEGWRFGDALMAGRLIPRRSGHGVTMYERLHPSHLWIPDLDRLRVASDSIKGDINDFDPIGPLTFGRGPGTKYFDTLAPLYAGIGQDCHVFRETELDCYDHLFYGSHFPSVSSAHLEGFLDVHECAASGNIQSLRGVWRKQEQIFKESRFHTGGNYIGNAQRVLSLLAAAQGRSPVSDDLAKEALVEMVIGFEGVEINDAGNRKLPRF